MNRTTEPTFFKSYMIIAIIGIFSFVSCDNSSIQDESPRVAGLTNDLHTRMAQLLDYEVDSMSFPRSYNIEREAIKKVPSSDWTSGFFPGTLWLMYGMTGDEAYRIRAEQWTQYIEKEKWNDRTHDMGFKIYCSFGNGFELTKDESYKRIILKSAETLITRFNDNVGCIRSWDFNKDKWEFPVIIDNMMNLELLFEATNISGDSTYYNIAVAHANTTLQHHYRPDESSVHVVVFDTITGGVKEKITHQGINDASSWARGQAWGIYGFTMCYRYTNDPEYLRRAQASADFFIEESKIRKDRIAYWDFRDPAIPDAPRDVSASTIVASALVELAEHSNKASYKEYASTIIATLHTPEYFLANDSKIPFVLNHCTGNYPANDEIDEPISYGDYYFIEAIARLENSAKN